MNRNKITIFATEIQLFTKQYRNSLKSAKIDLLRFIIMRSRVQVSDPLQNTKGHLYARCPFFVPRLSSSTDLRTTLCPAPFGCVRPPCFILPRPANPGRHLALSRREYFKNFLCRMKSVGYILLPKKYYFGRFFY